MEIEKKDIATLIPYARNAKKHDENQITQIAASIKEFGFLDPVEIDQNGLIIAGHGRVLAAQKLGLTEVPVVIHSHLNDNQRKAYTLLNNRLAETGGGWDTEMLKLELDELPEFDLSCFGEVLEGLLEQDISLNGLTDDDEVPEPPKEARTELGRIYQLGKHRLMCGDSTSKEEVKRLMDGEMAILFLTDPPYSVNFTKKSKEIFKNDSYCEIKNDNLSIEETSDKIWKPVFRNAFDNCSNDSSFYMFMPQGGDQMMMMMMMNENWQVKHELIWEKEAPVFSMNRLDYDYMHEPIIYGWKEKHKFYGDHSDKSIIKISRDSDKSHPTMKPVKLLSKLINNSSKKDNIILDLFGGSGSTLIACEQTNRQCRMMELDPIYCDVIVERYCKLKGIDSDKVFETGIAE